MVERTLTCHECGDTFLTTANGKAFYCSRKCRSQEQLRLAKAERQKKLIGKKCVDCGTDLPLPRVQRCRDCAQQRQNKQTRDYNISIGQISTKSFMGSCILCRKEIHLGANRRRKYCIHCAKVVKLSSAKKNTAKKRLREQTNRLKNPPPARLCLACGESLEGTWHNRKFCDACRKIRKRKSATKYHRNKRSQR